MEIKFRRDTSFRKQFFVPDSFAHPAKMDAQLLLWIVEKYSSPGETILDCMAGSGTTMLACGLGRNVILVELEEKFCKMMADNWNEVKMRPQLGSTMGNTKLINGDARALDMLVPNVELLDEIDGDSKVAVLYLLLGQVSDSKSLVLEVFIPSSLTQFIPMPISTINLNDQLPFRNEEIYDISTEPDLSLECYRLLSKLLLDNSFNVTFVGEQRTSARAKSNTSFNPPLWRIKGLPTGGALLVTTSEIALPSTFPRAILTTPLGDRSADFKWLPADLTDKFNSVFDTDSTTGDRAEMSLPILGLGIPSKKWLSTYLANSRDFLSAVACPTTGATKPDIMLQTRWANLKFLFAILANNNSLHNSIIPQAPIKHNARQLENVLVDKIITSPPFQAQKSGGNQGAGKYSGTDLSQGINRVKDDYAQSEHPDNIDNLPYGQLEGLVDKIVTSPPYADTPVSLKDRDDKQSIEASPDNIGNLPYGQIDKIVTSPPYEAGTSGPSRSPFWDRLANDPTSARYGRKKHPSVGEGYDSIITSPPYEEAMGKKHHSPVADKVFKEKGLGVYTDRVDSIITSPPYEGSNTTGQPDSYDGRHGPNSQVQLRDYRESKNNIGNLKSHSYLEAMLQVYQQCHKVLKPNGLMILVTKNFIRNKQVVRLDTDTIKLCEQAGFTYLERHYRKLPSQSFWRIIYKQKFPDVETIDFEDVLVFSK